METANKKIGFEPFCNIENTLVRAAADEDQLTVFFDLKILLVSEVIVNKTFSRLFFKFGGNVLLLFFFFSRFEEHSNVYISTLFLIQSSLDGH